MKVPTLLALALLASALSAQDRKSQAGEHPIGRESEPIGVSVGVPFYSVDSEFHGKIRDLEFDANQIEIEIQTLKARIEEDKAKEAEIWRKISQEAAAYAADHKIDPAKYDFDAKDIKYPQKKKP